MAVTTHPRSVWQRLRRIIRYRLTIPLMRSRHSAEHSARGMMMGVVWAFTPTFGIQMPLVFISWVVGRRLFKWDFNLVLGLAATWVSNLFTAVPFYYLFYLTGQIVLGRWQDLTGYRSFLALWQNTFIEGQSLLQQTGTLLRVLLLDWGVAMAIGSIPWATVMGLLTYRYSLKFVRAYRAAKAERMQRRP